MLDDDNIRSLYLDGGLSLLNDTEDDNPEDNIPLWDVDVGDQKEVYDRSENYSDEGRDEAVEDNDEEFDDENDDIQTITISKDEYSESEKLRFSSLYRYRKTLKTFTTEAVYQKLVNSRSSSLNSSDQNNINSSNSIEQPSALANCAMRSYQVEGLNWLIGNYNQSINCILGDEMGLGKSLQTISFIAHMIYEKRVKGLFLIICPLTVLSNWIKEFTRWCPSISVLRVHSTDIEEQNQLKKQMKDANRARVIITTYEMIKNNGMCNAFKRIIWRTIIADEGHRLKNDSSFINRAVYKLKSRFKFLLTVLYEMLLISSQ